MFHVGQKVVCIDVRNYDREAIGGLGALTEGAIYTVREVGLVLWEDKTPCIRVNEIVRSGDDCPYRAKRFRPLDETESSKSRHLEEVR